MLGDLLNRSRPPFHLVHLPKKLLSRSQPRRRLLLRRFQKCSRETTGLARMAPHSLAMRFRARLQRIDQERQVRKRTRRARRLRHLSRHLRLVRRRLLRHPWRRRRCLHHRRQGSRSSRLKMRGATVKVQGRLKGLQAMAARAILPQDPLSRVQTQQRQARLSTRLRCRLPLRRSRAQQRPNRNCHRWPHSRFHRPPRSLLLSVRIGLSGPRRQTMRRRTGA